MASAVLRHLAADSGHTAYLAQLDDGRLMVVDVAEGPRPPWVEDLEKELAVLRPGQVVEEHGQFREQVACAGAVVPGTRWATGISTRGLAIPPRAVARLGAAVRDLSRT
jgi:hypothetical protein